MTAPAGDAPTKSAPDSPQLFPDSLFVPYEGFHFELVADGASRRHDLLAGIREQVIELAARSRGWDEPEQIEHFRRVFKLEALFEADSLALVWQGQTVVGLAGMARDRTASGASILHVGSLALLAVAQRRGILPVLFSLLWDALLERPEIRENLLANRAYLTAITQSPYIMAFLRGVSELYPGPGRTEPDPEIAEAAAVIAHRFDPHVAFDPDTFILREEAEFFYRRTPYSANRAVNDYCDRHLRYAEGDTFVLVGRARPAAISRFRTGCERAHPELYRTLRTAANLPDRTHS